MLATEARWNLFRCIKAVKFEHSKQIQTNTLEIATTSSVKSRLKVRLKLDYSSGKNKELK